MARANQHYVPQLLLRGFLSQIGREAAKEQVRVFDVREQRGYAVSTRNIMAENNFNQWSIDEHTVATFEPAATAIEDRCAPLIKRIRDERHLAVSQHELGELAYFMAFQFIRTKSMRELPRRLDAQLRKGIAARGLDPDLLESPFETDDESLKLGHIGQQVKGLPEYAGLFAEKVFFLMQAPDGKAFYLGDSPVVLHCEREHRSPHRGLGLSVPYIQIYLPLSHDLLLCAYDPAVLGDLMRSNSESMDQMRGKALAAVRAGRLEIHRMKAILDAGAALDTTKPMISRIQNGQPLLITPENVDHYNSLQVNQCDRFIVDPAGVFEVARVISADQAWRKSREE